MTTVPSQWQSWVTQASQGTGLPPSVVAAQISAESGFSPSAVSPAGAEGIAQFLPSTFQGLGIAGSPFNPQDALQAYIALMSQLLKQYNGNVRDALAAYNAGPNLTAGYGYADSILSAAGQPVNYTAGSGTYGGTRPGGSQAASGAAVDQLIAEYVALRDAPRTNPDTAAGKVVPLGASVGWWFAQFQTFALKVFGG